MGDKVDKLYDSGCQVGLSSAHFDLASKPLHDRAKKTYLDFIQVSQYTAVLEHFTCLFITFSRTLFGKERHQPVNRSLTTAVAGDMQ